MVTLIQYGKSTLTLLIQASWHGVDIKMTEKGVARSMLLQQERVRAARKKNIRRTIEEGVRK